MRTGSLGKCSFVSTARAQNDITKCDRKFATRKSFQLWRTAVRKYTHSTYCIQDPNVYLLVVEVTKDQPECHLSESQDYSQFHLIGVDESQLVFRQVPERVDTEKVGIPGVFVTVRPGVQLVRSFWVYRPVCEVTNVNVCNSNFIVR